MNEEQELLNRIIPLLTEWYQAHRREMPWRREPTPYHVWISEIMLQQTRIEAAIPYYERFLKAFPTVEALAAADGDQLMKLWEGLGYYSRARNLKKAADILVSDYGGKLPQQASQLRSLPGIGAYTAGAVASIAYGQPEPAVDGNVLRVITRVTACGEDIMLTKTRERITKALREVYPAGKAASELTEALMELGEIVCIPNGEPKCAVCPLRLCCRACVEGKTDCFPVRSPKKQRRIEEHTVLLLSCGGKYAVRRRDGKGLLAGMWEFPNMDGRASADEVATFLHQAGTEAILCKPCGEAKHVFTHVEWHMCGYEAECSTQTERFVWKTAGEIRRECAIPSAFRFYIGLIV